MMMTDGEIGIDRLEDVLYGLLQNASDEDIHHIAEEKIKEWDTNNDSKVTLADFTEYVIKALAQEKDPWEFATE